jgi:hypothetical protein
MKWEGCLVSGSFFSPLLVSECIVCLTPVYNYSICVELGLPSLYGGDAPHGGNGIGSFGLMG